MKKKVLIVDDEPRMAQAICTALSRNPDLQVRTAQDGAAALATVRQLGADVVVTDWKMPKLDGLQLMAALKAEFPTLPVILMTAFGDVPSAVQAIKRGAFDYVTKPFDNDELRALVARALQIEALQQENRALKAALAKDRRLDRMIAESPAMQDVLSLVERAAPSNSTVLITGESGTGKELIARLVHHLSPRTAGPFVAVNIKAFASGVLESELFGHASGAFTGAQADHEGCFERANGGTLFLDELGELPEDAQAKLLRVLQEREIQPVGGHGPRPIDVRVVAATHRDLHERIRNGNFREDLYFRLAVIPVHLPPLRERREDILPLADGMTARMYESSGTRRPLSPEARDHLVGYAWPGNVRELENTLERALVLARGPQIEPEDLLLMPPATSLAATPLSLQGRLDAAAISAINAALQTHQGRRADAAAELGMDRSTLYRWMKRLKLD